MLNFVERGIVRLYLSEAVLTEIEDVLNRPEIRSHFQTLTDEIAAAFLVRLRKHSQLVRRVPKQFIYPRDPDDEPYINLAAEATADYLVSRDKDLLDLITDYTVEANEFRQKFRPLRVIEPLDFLKEVRKLENKSGASYAKKNLHSLD